MKNWKEFEEQCTDYLNQEFCDFANFILMGSSDSTISDILVKTHTNKTFYIEVKHSPAQCGQFVLLPDIKTRQFVYSERNVNKSNSFAEQIIEFMNTDFKTFNNAGTTGKEICFNDCEYMFSKRDNLYEIRRLSNTFNANVIFSVELKNNVQGLSGEKFIEYLR